MKNLSKINGKRSTLKAGNIFFNKPNFPFGKITTGKET